MFNKMYHQYLVVLHSNQKVHHFYNNLLTEKFQTNVWHRKTHHLNRICPMVHFTQQMYILTAIDCSSSDHNDRKSIVMSIPVPSTSSTSYFSKDEIASDRK